MIDHSDIVLDNLDILKYPCGGVIVLREYKDKLQTILVQTHRGNYSYPKGKRDRGENIINCALRETEEETGISASNLSFLTDINGKVLNYLEYTKKNNPSVLYFVAFIKKDINQFTFDSEELSNVDWYNVNDVFKLTDNIKQPRIEILKQIVKYLI